MTVASATKTCFLSESAYNQCRLENDSLKMLNLLMDSIGKDLGLYVRQTNNGFDYEFLRAKTLDVVHHMMNYDVGLNSHIAHLKAKDKALCFRLLTLGGVAAVPHYFLRTSKTSDVRHWDNTDFSSNKEMLAVKLPSTPVIVKPNMGGAGRDIHLVSDINTFSRVVEDLEQKQLTVCYSPYYDFDVEYRCVVLDGRVMLAFGKKRQDGNLQHNLSDGAEVVPVPVELSKSLENVAVRASKVLGLRFSAVDIIVVDGVLTVLEVNGSVTLKRVLLHSYDMAVSSYHVYKQALITSGDMSA